MSRIETPGNAPQDVLSSAGAAPLLYLHRDEDVEVHINGMRACREGGFLAAYNYARSPPPRPPRSSREGIGNTPG